MSAHKAAKKAFQELFLTIGRQHNYRIECRQFGDGFSIGEVFRGDFFPMSRGATPKEALDTLRHEITTYEQLPEPEEWNP